MAKSPSHNPRPTPMPDNYTGGSNDFGVIRGTDSRDRYGYEEGGSPSRNIYRPGDNGTDTDDDMMGY